MKKTTCLTISAVVFALLLGASIATALEPIPLKSGFGGFIRPGVGYMRFKSNMVASFMGHRLSEKYTNSLTDSPNTETNSLILAPFALQYTFASTRTQLFVGTDLQDLVRFDMSQQFGVKQEIGRFGMLQGGVLFSGVPAKVWKDPYVVDQKRKDTSSTSNGGRLAWDRIFGSNFQLQYTYRKIDLGSEKSGDFLGLSSSDRDRLDREGDRHVAEAFYRFNFAKKHRFMPQVIYARDDLDGDAMASDTFDFQLTYAYFGDPFSLTLNGLIGTADYDKRNPIYSRTRDDDRYGFQGNLYYRNPWGYTLLGSAPINFYLGAAYFETDANIDFYDQEVTMVSGGLFFKW
jgi:hypothetical protein